MRLWFQQRTEEDALTVEGTGLVLVTPQRNDYREWKQLRQESRSFLKPWEPRWAVNDLTPAGYRHRLLSYEKQRIEKTGLIWFIRRDEAGRAGELLGGISITGMRLGASRTGHVGYWMGERHAGKGIMRSVLGRVSRHAFEKLGLFRLEAACLPHNVRSTRVLEACGFRREGLARSYLEIDGKRRDHLIFALLATDLPDLHGN